jgi:hypothetical protein
MASSAPSRSRVMRHLLFRVDPGDHHVRAVAAVLTAVALGACWFLHAAPCASIQWWPCVMSRLVRRILYLLRRRG